MADGSSDTPTRASLLLRIRDPRDTASWNTFVEVYGPLVYRHCRRRGLQNADAQDVTQQVFTQVHRAIHQFDYRPEQGRFRDWLGTITRNQIATFFRQQARKVTAKGGGDDDDLAETVTAPVQDDAWTEEFGRHLLETALARIRAQVSESQFRAFELLWRDDRPAAEVALQLGQNIDWVYQAKSRILKRLQEEVRELAEDCPVFGL